MKKLTYNFLVVEDELHVCEEIKRRMDNFSSWSCIGLSSFYDDALLLIKTQRPELIFMDYSIRGGNTFSLLEEIDKLNGYHPFIIFFTGYQKEQQEIPEQAVNFYKVNKYIVKPIFEKLSLHLDAYLREAEEWINEKEFTNSLWVKTTSNENVRLYPQQIVYIKQSDHNSRLKLIATKDNEQIEIKASWEYCKKVAEEFKIDYAFANERLLLVNKKHIAKIKKPFIWLVDDTRIQVSRNNWKDVVG